MFLGRMQECTAIYIYISIFNSFSVCKHVGKIGIYCCFPNPCKDMNLSNCSSCLIYSDRLAWSILVLIQPRRPVNLRLSWDGTQFHEESGSDGIPKNCLPLSFYVMEIVVLELLLK